MESSTGMKGERDEALRLAKEAHATLTPLINTDRVSFSVDELITVIRLARAQPQQEPVAVYWLIERGSPAEWWVSGMPEVWTTDSFKAQRFNEWGAREHIKDLLRWGVRGDLRVTQHVDCDGPPTEISCPECGASGLLYECSACSTSTYPASPPAQRDLARQSAPQGEPVTRLSSVHILCGPACSVCGNPSVLTIAYPPPDRHFCPEHSPLLYASRPAQPDVVRDACRLYEICLSWIKDFGCDRSDYFDEVVSMAKRYDAEIGSLRTALKHQSTLKNEAD